MKLKLILLALIALVYSCEKGQKEASQFNRATDFNFDWKFKLVNDTTLPSQVPLKDADWRGIRLPHDWSVELPFSEKWEGATGYLPGGVGIYQKHFKTPASPEEKSTFINFDGVYNNATFWLNGTKLGFNPYGYSPINYDLTDLLKTDGSDNILTVHVDRSRYADSRWYTGSGIYRNVKLVVLDKLRIPIWGTFVTTPKIDTNSAKVKIQIDVENHYPDNVAFNLETKILDPSGSVVAQILDTLSLNSKAKETFTQNLEVGNPQLWDIETPNLYHAVTTVSKDGKTVDEYTTRFGIRSLEFSKDFGFKLNGKITNIKGVCLHHAAGLVGAAVPKGVWKRRFEALKACGVNAIRTAHNPYSEEFLELCDEMGILVQNEFFDEWDYAKDKRRNYHDRSFDYITRGYVEHFQEWAKTDLTRTMLRDRNHPSVFQWSIGNEIEWTYLHYRYATGFWKDPNDPQNSGSYWGSGPILTPEEIKANYEKAEKGEYILAETAHKLAKWTRALDTTRPITTNMVVPQTSMVSGYADAVDISGFSYRNKDIAWATGHWPERHITINENPGTLDDWQQVIEHPGVFSIFMWTGIDYMGERHGDWPNKSGWGDLLDLAGFKYQGWNYFKSIWVDEPHISIGTLPLAKSGFKQTSISGQQLPENSNAYKWRDSNMHWNYEEGETVVVEVCSNYPAVELFINGRSLGTKEMSPDRLFRWTIPYEAGTLTAKARLDGKEIMTELHTAGKPVSIKFTSDKDVLKADGYDVAHLVVQLVDENGREVKTENATIEFKVEGNVSWLGVDNGATDNIQDFKSKKLTTAKGRALAIIQSTRESGAIIVTVNADGFEPQTITLNSK